MSKNSIFPIEYHVKNPKFYFQFFRPKITFSDLNFDQFKRFNQRPSLETEIVAFYEDLNVF